MISNDRSTKRFLDLGQPRQQAGMANGGGDAYGAAGVGGGGSGEDVRASPDVHPPTAGGGDASRERDGPEALENNPGSIFLSLWHLVRGP